MSESPKGRMMRVTLDVLVTDMTDADRLDMARGLCFEDDEDPAEIEKDFPRVAEYSAGEVASVIETLGHAYAQEEMWAGSEVYAKFDRVKVVSADWVAEGNSHG